MSLGAIGLKLAESLRTLGYQVLGWSRTRHSHAGIETFAGQEELPAFLARTRILVPLLPATQGLIDAKVFAGLPRGAHLIQIARGGIVEEEVMMEALDGGRPRPAPSAPRPVRPCRRKGFWRPRRARSAAAR
ncbi:MAG: hypothetical protein MO853_07755 [Candidatus Protistobacter heckmanni]|nr:hypothetical protein [Candidatus Protistobacter heckmanni]